MRRLPPLLGTLGLEVEDIEPGDLDQDGLGGQGLADRVGLDPGVVASRPARDLAELLGQLPLLLVEPGQRPLAVILLAGLGVARVRAASGCGRRAVGSRAWPRRGLRRRGPAGRSASACWARPLPLSTHPADRAAASRSSERTRASDSAVWSWLHPWP